LAKGCLDYGKIIGLMHWCGIGFGILWVCRILANRQSSVRPIKGDEDSLHNSVEEGAEA